MSSRNLRRVLLAAALVAGLCLPFGGAEARPLGGERGAGEARAGGERVWAWVQGFVESLWEKAGMTISPDGGPTEHGMHIDPNGLNSPSGDTGMLIDPHG